MLKNKILWKHTCDVWIPMCTATTKDAERKADEWLLQCAEQLPSDAASCCSEGTWNRGTCSGSFTASCEFLFIFIKRYLLILITADLIAIWVEFFTSHLLMKDWLFHVPEGKFFWWDAKWRSPGGYWKVCSFIFFFLLLFLINSLLSCFLALSPKGLSNTFTSYNFLVLEVITQTPGFFSFIE